MTIMNKFTDRSPFTRKETLPIIFKKINLDLGLELKLYLIEKESLKAYYMFCF